MAPELWILGGIGLLIATVGVPAIRRGILLPREMTFETPADDALTDRQRSHFQRMDTAVSSLGYRPRELRGHEPPGRKPHARLPQRLRPGDPRGELHEGALRHRQRRGGGAELLRVDHQVRGRHQPHDPQRDVSDIFDRMPDQHRHDYPGVSDPAGLKARHDPRAEALRQHQPRFSHGTDVLAEYREEWCRWLLLGAACTASGAAVGWIFTSKSFVWALVLGYVPLRLIDPHAGRQLLLAVWMGLVAERVAAWRMKRTLLV